MTALAARSELTRLADTAVDHSGGHTVAVVRGFDRASRQRAAVLRHKLQRHGVTAIDLTPLVLTLRHSERTTARTVLDETKIGLVVQAASGSSAAPALAAELGVPLLHTGPVPGTARRSALGVFVGNTLAAVALDRVELRPLDAAECELRLQSGTSSTVRARGAVSVQLERADAGRNDRMLLEPDQPALVADELLDIAPHSGAYTLVVDDRPVAPLTEPVRLRCLVDRLQCVST